LAESYLKEHPHASAYILTYSEFSKATKPLSIFKGVFTIDRKKISTFSNHNLYSNGFALDELVEELKPIESMVWSNIVNYSSDKATTFLCNYLADTDETQISGVKFGDQNNVRYDSPWEIVFNEVMTASEYPPVHFSTAYHGMCNVNEYKGVNKIKKVKKHDLTVENNFQNLRRLNAKDGSSCSLIGLHLFTSLDNKNWSEDKVVKIIENLLCDSELYPILLIAPTKDERDRSKLINEKFDNKLIIVESDFLALTSVLSGLDILITPDTSVKHLADLVDCRVVEYATNLETTLKQGTSNTGNVIVLGPKNMESLVVDSVKFLLTPNEETYTKIMCSSVYITFSDKMGWNLKPADGHFSIDLLKRQIQRSYISKWIGSDLDWDIKTYFSDYKYSQVQTVLDSEKAAISEVSKDLLGTLRSLNNASDSSSEVNSFIVALDRLLNRSEDKFVSSISVIEFKARLENLQCSSQEEQLRSVEDLLYKLKKNLQIALDCLNQIEKDARSMPVTKKKKNDSVEARSFA
ncbi:MAG: hypothetical protein ACJARO_001845, partial [Bacteriovoracaceae bacterium]